MSKFTEQAKPFLVVRLYAGKITLDEFIQKFEAAVRRDEKSDRDARAAQVKQLTGTNENRHYPTHSAGLCRQRLNLVPQKAKAAQEVAERIP